MPDVELCVWCLTILGLLLGAWSIYWVRTELSPLRVLWGRRIFVATMLKLGGTGFVAILERAGSLAPLGIVSVLLVVAMLWESPR
jgi:hypothetical protein